MTHSDWIGFVTLLVTCLCILGGAIAMFIRVQTKVDILFDYFQRKMERRSREDEQKWEAKHGKPQNRG